MHYIFTYNNSQAPKPSFLHSPSGSRWTAGMNIIQPRHSTKPLMLSITKKVTYIGFNKHYSRIQHDDEVPGRMFAMMK